MTQVKRRYDGSMRRVRAEQLGRALVTTAREQFLANGYAATSVASVARACGVSVESVYRRFPGKAALILAVVEQALAGEGPVPAEARSDELPSGDLDTLLRGWGRLSAEVAPRVAPLLLVVKAAAASDRELDDVVEELDRDRRLRMTDNARRLDAAGHLPANLSVEQAADLLWTYSSPEVYDLLVHRSGWSVERYQQFIVDGLTGHLAPREVGSVTPRRTSP
jgi:AcrR family transcriptional regulator